MSLSAAIDALARQVDGARLMAHLTEFSRWTKHAGTAGERASLDYVRAQLDSFGYRTELILHDAYISLPGAAHIDVDGTRLPCITQSFSRSSPPEGLQGRAIMAGAGSPADFDGVDARGKIIVVDGIATPAVSQRAARAGAIGQIHLSPSAHAHEMCVSPVWGSPTHETVSQLPSTVVATLAKEEGARLKEILAASPQVPVTLHASVDTGWRKTPILIAAIDPPGADADCPFVMFSGHHDTWHFGVMDNGGANATMLETARLCALDIKNWRRALRLYFWSGHSQGRYSGSAWYVDNHWEELAARAVAHVNIDSTGARGNTVLSDAQTAPELFGLASEAVRDQGGQTLTGYRVARAGDQSFWGVGVPAIFSSLGEQPASGAPPAASFLFGGPGKQGAGTGWWWHTPEDTLDKMDADIAMRDTRVYLHVVYSLLASPLLPIDFGAHAGMLLGELDRIGQAIGGRFDLALPRQRAEALQRLSRRLSAAAVAAAPADIKRINRCIMQVARVLVPVDSTTGDRFDHDPALALPPYPSLQPLRDLARCEAGSDAEKFTRVAAQRGVNRVLHALNDANRAIESCLRELSTEQAG